MMCRCVSILRMVSTWQVRFLTSEHVLAPSEKKISGYHVAECAMVQLLHASYGARKTNSDQQRQQEAISFATPIYVSAKKNM